MRQVFNKNKAAAAFVLLLCCALLFGCSADGKEESLAGEKFSETKFSEDISAADESAVAADEAPQISGELLECNYFDEKTFISHDRTSEPYSIGGKLTGGVVTHHLLAGKMIAGFFKTAAENRGDEIETVVIAAPMHYSDGVVGGGDFCTSLLNWQTPFGTALTDTELSLRFISELGAKQDDRMLPYDHSASSLLPYVKYYLPDAEVSCLLVSERSEASSYEKLASLLAEVSEEKNCLFVFSIDFSHYLSPEETEAMDRVTLDAVMSRSFEKITVMTDANLDSPRCMCAFLKLAELTGGNVAELDHGNSLSMSDMPYTEAAFGNGLTSYFVFGSTVPQ